LSDPFDDFHDALVTTQREDVRHQNDMKEYFVNNPKEHVDRIHKHEMDASDYIKEDGKLLHKESKEPLTANQKQAFTNKVKHLILSGAVGPHPLLEEQNLIYKDGALITNREKYRED